MRPPQATSLRPAIATLFLGVILLYLSGCAETATPPAGHAGLRVEVRFASDQFALRNGGESFVYDRVRVRATPYDDETNQFGDSFADENEIAPGETRFRLELTVTPASYYRIEVEAIGSVDADTSIGGVLFFGREFLEDVEAGRENSITVELTAQFPEVGTEVFPDEDALLLSWNAIPEATRYRIRGTNNEGNRFESLSVRTDTTFSIPPRLTGDGLTRTFRVAAEFADRSSGAYSLEAVADLGSPVAPGPILDLAATAITDSSLVLTFTASGDDGELGRASSYDLRISTAPIDETNFANATPVPGVPVPGPSGTSEVIPVTSLGAETLYYFGLYAVDDVPLRSPLALTSAETAPTPDRIPPATIADLRATSITGTSATLLWTAPGDDGSEGSATTYEARFSTTLLDDGNFESATLIGGFPSPAPGGTQESFLLDDLAPRKTYFVALRAEDDEGNRSEVSNVAVFETPDLVAPDAVLDLTAEAINENRVALTWTAPADEDGGAIAQYDLRWSESTITDANFGSANEVVPPAPGTPGSEQGVLVNGFSRDTEIFFALRSFDGSGNGSALSNIASTRTPDLTPPSRVADLIAISLDENTLGVSWTATGDDGPAGTASRYELRFSTAEIDESNFADAVQIPLATPQAAGEAESIEVSGLIPRQLYHLRLRVIDDAGNESELSNPASAVPTDSTPPAAVVLSVEQTGPVSVLLAWTAPGDDGNLGRAHDYDLRYSTIPIDAGNFLDATPVLIPSPAPAGTPENAEVIGLDEATTYFFALVTSDEAANPSPLSNIVSATTGSTPPTSPSGLAAAPLSPTSVGLVWQDNAENEDNYEVERRQIDETNFTRIATIGPGAGVVSYEDTPVADRTTFVYRVRATNAGGPSGYSNEATATTPVPPPTTFAASALAFDEIRLTWAFTSSDPEGFRIERLSLSGWTTVADLPGSDREYLDTELTFLTTYTYRMLAYEGNFSSAYTAEVSEQTPDEPPFCSIDPPSLDFDIVTVGSADTLFVTITNTGGQVLTGSVILEDCGGGFTVLNGNSLNLRRGEGREVGVVFAPQSPGAATCSLVGPGCDAVGMIGIGENTFWSDRFASGDLGVNSTIRTFAPALDGFYAGGAFTLAGDQVTSYTAQFIDDTWFGMGPSLSGQVRVLANTEFGIYAGGDFSSYSSAPHHIAEWTGSSWAALNRSPDGIVRALAGWDFTVIVGGSFDSTYWEGELGTGPPGVAEWVPCVGRALDGSGDTVGRALDGSGDSEPQRGCNFYRDPFANPNGSVEVATIWQGDVYVGGTFTEIGGLPIAYLARYNNGKSGWEAVGLNGGINNPVYALYPGQSELWVGGQFTAVDGQPSRGVASWSGTAWTPRTAGEDFRTTYAITELNGHIVIGGSWTTSNGSQTLTRIAEFDGSGWLPLGTGIDSAGGFVYALHEDNGALYVGGSFSSAGGLPSSNIARWEPVR